jgi:hypothetical protein
VKKKEIIKAEIKNGIDDVFWEPFFLSILYPFKQEAGGIHMLKGAKIKKRSNIQYFV